MYCIGERGRVCGSGHGEGLVGGSDAGDEHALACTFRRAKTSKDLRPTADPGVLMEHMEHKGSTHSICGHVHACLQEKT